MQSATEGSPFGGGGGEANAVSFIPPPPYSVLVVGPTAAGCDMSTALPPSSSTSVDSNKDVSTWRPSQVAQWLRLTERYVFLPYFIAQSVDGAALLKLSDGQVEGSLSLDAVLKLDDIPKPTSTQRRLLIEHVQKLNEAQPQEDQPGWQLVREATRDLLVQKDMPKTLNDWRRTIKTNSVAHDYLTRVYRDRATILTVFVVALNAIVGSAVFSSAGGGGQDSESWQQVLSIAAGALSMLAGVLSAVKSALGWETRAEMHRAAALRYSKLWIRFDDMHGLMKVAYVSSEGDGNVPAKNEGWADWFKYVCMHVRDASCSF